MSTSPSASKKRHLNQPMSLRGKNKRSEGTKMVWPKGAQERYGISSPTRWRWEKKGKLPPRDVFIAGVPTGWRPETLDAADRGLTAA